MSETRPALAEFDGDTFDSVAEETGFAVDRLRTLTRRHQDGIRELPGVDDIVYEWRNQFHMDPLVYRSEQVYVLAVQGHVWDEFASSLDLTDDELATLKAVHRTQATKIVPDSDRFERDDPVVLTRP